MKVAGIADPTTAKGLRLAGIKDSYEAETREEAGEAFEQITEGEEIGVIILTEGLAQKISKKLSEFRGKRDGGIPMVVEIPGRKGPIPERREIVDELVKRAVGIKVKE